MYIMQIVSPLPTRLEFSIAIGQELIIGRTGQSDIVINDPMVSARHFSIKVDKKGAVFICDLFSTNGIFLNNEKILSSRFRANDVLGCGDQEITFCLDKLSPSAIRAIGFSRKAVKKELILPKTFNIPEND